MKPHASPVLHALEYLLGRLDRSYLTRLRDFGGLQSYPSRTKDPFPVDFSTGSVGLGSAAPLFAALADRYVEAHFGASTGGRFISLLGDAELDEGNLWEALTEPLARRLGNVLWLVDLNRQSLDRVVPGIKAHELEQQFRTVRLAGAGAQVRAASTRGVRPRAAASCCAAGSTRCRTSSTSRCSARPKTSSEPRCSSRFEERSARGSRELLDGHTGRLRSLVGDLGGHDLADVLGRTGAGPRRRPIGPP